MTIKMTMADGTVFEGTAEELAELQRLSNGEPDEQAKPKLAVGDYAKVVGDSVFGDICEGTYVKISDDGYDDGHIRIDLLDESDFDLVKPEALEKVELTDEDLTFLKIGRNPGEFKKGDIVRVKDACGAPLSPGDLCEVKCDSTGMDVVHVTERGWAVSVDKLIAPVDARVDGDE